MFQELRRKTDSEDSESRVKDRAGTGRSGQSGTCSPRQWRREPLGPRQQADREDSAGGAAEKPTGLSLLMPGRGPGSPAPGGVLAVCPLHSRTAAPHLHTVPEVKPTVDSRRERDKEPLGGVDGGALRGSRPSPLLGGPGPQSSAQPRERGSPAAPASATFFIHPFSHNVPSLSSHGLALLPLPASPFSLNLLNFPFSSVSTSLLSWPPELSMVSTPIWDQE